MTGDRADVERSATAEREHNGRKTGDATRGQITSTDRGTARITSSRRSPHLPVV
jgi:hypothetical protein